MSLLKAQKILWFKDTHRYRFKGTQKDVLVIELHIRSIKNKNNTK